MVTSPAAAASTVLLVDMANMVGSVPDGWWRDRAGAAERVLADLERLVGADVPGPAGDPIRLVGIVAVLEGAANRATEPPGDLPNGSLQVIRASGSGDDTISHAAAYVVAAGDRILVVTADRGLRARLPTGAATTGPGWLNGLLGRGASAL